MFFPFAEFSEEIEEPCVGRVLQVMRMICPINACEVMSQHIRARLSYSFDLADVEIGKKGKMIEFREVKESRITPLYRKPLPHRPKDRRVALPLALVVARP